LIIDYWLYFTKRILNTNYVMRVMELYYEEI
jgi:hypothetical protein